MESLAKLFGSLLVFVYHCFDRIVIHGYLSGLSRPEQVVHFVRQVLGIPVVFLETPRRFGQLGVGRRQLLGQAGYLSGSADAGNHILALGVEQVLPIEDLVSGGRVSGEVSAGDEL